MNYSFDITNFVKNFLPTRKRTTKHVSWLVSLLSPMQFWSTHFFTNYKTGYTGARVFSYTAAKTFNVGDLVYYSGTIYICILASTAHLPTNATYFSVKSFTHGDLVHNVENSVYLCVADNIIGISPPNTTYWYLMQKNFVGLDSRIRASASIIVYEYILNKWFGTQFNYPSSVNDVYITNNPTDINGFIVGISDTDTSYISFNDTQQDSFINLTYTTVTNNYIINIPLAIYDSLNPSDASGSTITKDAIVKNFADKYNLAGLQYSINPY